jgi:hypothetical protein
MESQNLLIAALTYMVRFQATHCETAKERALMMFDALAELKGCTPELQFLCNEANQLLIN